MCHPERCRRMSVPPRKSLGVALSAATPHSVVPPSLAGYAAIPARDTLVVVALHRKSQPCSAPTLNLEMKRVENSIASLRAQMTNVTTNCRTNTRDIILHHGPAVYEHIRRMMDGDVGGATRSETIVVEITCKANLVAEYSITDKVRDLLSEQEDQLRFKNVNLVLQVVIAHSHLRRGGITDFPSVV